MTVTDVVFFKANCIEKALFLYSACTRTDPDSYLKFRYYPLPSFVIRPKRYQVWEVIVRIDDNEEKNMMNAEYYKS